MHLRKVFTRKDFSSAVQNFVVSPLNNFRENPKILWNSKTFSMMTSVQKFSLSTYLHFFFFLESYGSKQNSSKKFHTICSCCITKFSHKETIQWEGTESKNVRTKNSKPHSSCCICVDVILEKDAWHLKLWSVVFCLLNEIKENIFKCVLKKSVRNEQHLRCTRDISCIVKYFYIFFVRLFRNERWQLSKAMFTNNLFQFYSFLIWGEWKINIFLFFYHKWSIFFPQNPH